MLTDLERGWYDLGVSLDAKSFAAEAEEAYRRSFEALHAPPGGVVAEQVEAEYDEETGELLKPSRTIYTAPFGETYVPSSKMGISFRGMEGELRYQQQQMAQSRGQGPARDEASQLHLKKERELRFLLIAPVGKNGMDLVTKAVYLRKLLATDFYPNELPLQPETAEGIMAVFAQASVQQRLLGTETEGRLEGGSPTPPNAVDAPPCSSPVKLQGSKEPHTTGLPPPSPVPYSFDTMPFLSAMRALYRHQKMRFVAPTAYMIELMMVLVSSVKVPSSEINGSDSPSFHLAQRLLLDCDRYMVLPSRTALTAYLQICHHHNEHVCAAAQIRHIMKNLCISLDASMMAALIRGLTQGGLVEEALELLGRMQGIPVNLDLLHASLETVLLSGDPLACFSLYHSVLSKGNTQSKQLRPNSDTFVLLLLACEKTGLWGSVGWIAREMQHRRIRGSPACLNLLLKGLMMEGKEAAAATLKSKMEQRRISVWPDLNRVPDYLDDDAKNTGDALENLGTLRKT